MATLQSGNPAGRRRARKCIHQVSQIITLETEANTR